MADAAHTAEKAAADEIIQPATACLHDTKAEWVQHRWVPCSKSRHSGMHVLLELRHTLQLTGWTGLILAHLRIHRSADPRAYASGISKSKSASRCPDAVLIEGCDIMVS